MQGNLTSLRSDMDKRFDDMKGGVSKQFDDMKDDVNKRFAQVDKRFEQIITSLDKLTDKLDYRDERQRSFTIRMFTISITISILGVTGAFLKALAII